MLKYPLAWPPGWRRTLPHLRTTALFNKRETRTDASGTNVIHRQLSVHDSVKRVIDDLTRFGVEGGSAYISTNLELRLDGSPRLDRGPPNDPGVAVYWKRPEDKVMKCMAIDRYDRVADNIAAVAATLDAMRAIERHGGAMIIERAFEGFALLLTGSRPWRDVLEVGALDATVESVRAAYLRKRSKTHPDKNAGSDGRDFLAVQEAYAQAQRELGFTD